MVDKKEVALLADDEPFYLEWLDDFLSSKSLEVEYASTVDEAVKMMKNKKYRLLVVDLNIPMLSQGSEYAARHSGAYDDYPGLYIAAAARNAGYRTKQVIIYSVFVSKSIEEAADRLYCTYMTKMHPSDLKREIENVLSYDPSADASTE